MIALQRRTEEAGIIKHRAVNPRVYEEDGIHLPRILKARDYVMRVGSYANGVITELGCGAADISGHFTVAHRVHAYDCNPDSLKVARERHGNFAATGVIPEPHPSDVLIMCEFLEHLADPMAMVKAWLPLAQTAVISHPIEGDMTGDNSAGEHQWSLSEADFLGWFAAGGHEIVEQERFRMGGYNIAIARSRRV